MVDLAMSRTGQFEIGRVIERTFGVIGANFRVLGLMALLLAGLPQAVLAVALILLKQDPTEFSLIGMLGSLVAAIGSFVLQAAVVHASVVDLNGGKASFDDSLKVGLRNFWPVLAISIIVTFGIAFGMLLFLVPGIMMAIAWVVAVPVRVMEKKGVFASLGRSAELTRGARWSIFGLLVIYLLIFFVIGILFMVLGVGARAVSGGADALAVRAVISPVLNTAIGLITASGVAAAYYELRSRKEGIGPEDLAAVFD